MTNEATCPYDTVLVIGTGVMGRGIAHVCAAAGLRVLLKDAQPAAAEKARATIVEAFRKEASKGRMTAEAAASASERIGLDDGGRLPRTTLVVEAIFEDLIAKQRLFAELEQRADKDTTLASNTSSLSVTAIAASCEAPERVAGLHFFNPVPRMRLVEVVRTPRTPQSVVDELVTLVQRLGMKPIATQDTPGFVVNHAGRAYVTEALQIVAEQVAPVETIDAILRETAGFRMGPFELLDLTGLDVSHPVMESIYRQYYENPRYRPSPIARLRMQAGLLGRKSGTGFYQYVDGVKSTPNEQSEPVQTDPTRIHFPGGEHGVPAQLRERLSGGASVTIVPAIDQADVCLVAPLGLDLAATVAALGLPPERTVAIDAMFATPHAVTLMKSAATSPEAVRAATGAAGAMGARAHWIDDSAGFVAQRVVGMMVHLAADMAQQRIAGPRDIDSATEIALGYPRGPLSWGDQLGPNRVLNLMANIHSVTGDARYRPSLWLRRRVQLGLALVE